MERKRNSSTRLIKKTHLCCSSFFFFFFFFFFSICSLFITPTIATPITCLDTSKCPMIPSAHMHFQVAQVKMVHEGKRKSDSLGWTRRMLGGPGSSPPRCNAKCGKCTPCRPVHVPVPPGTPVTAEYYPEAWRCKCGNKLYMP